ncbi:MAG TPA: hypothetical protein VK444_05175 [Methanobacteriaceae archaeon]|nr:hypothetical protein [Methanobacteriaceae archaeon]
MKDRNISVLILGMNKFKYEKKRSLRGLKFPAAYFRSLPVEGLYNLDGYLYEFGKKFKDITPLYPYKMPLWEYILENQTNVNIGCN